MAKLKILVIGKRNGILQWYENILDSNDQSADYVISGFALNHNNTLERFLKKIIPNKDVYTAKLLEKKLYSFQPDLILIVDLFYFSPSLLKVLSKYPCKKAHWIGDFFDQRLAKSKEIIDLFCFTDSSFIEDAKKIGITNSLYLPLAYNPNIFFEGNESKDERLLFIGAWSPNRQELIEQIPLPLTIYGKGWDKLKKADSIIHPYNIPLTQVADLYRKHKYILNLINKKNIRQGMNMRCFEAPACGCILVSEYVKDLEFNFDIRNDLIYFSDHIELKNKIKNSKINPKLLMYKVKENHTYKDRINYILKIINIHN